jgi:hypothetical protein
LQERHLFWIILDWGDLFISTGTFLVGEGMAIQTADGNPPDSIVVMLCYKCREPLKSFVMGSYEACPCGVLGYLSNVMPLPKDRWWPITWAQGLVVYKPIRETIVMN